MAVTVFTQGTTTNDRRKENHESGQFVSVRDGHLFVLSKPTDNPANCVAVYAPGKWISAQRCGARCGWAPRAAQPWAGPGRPGQADTERARVGQSAGVLDDN